MDTRTRKQEALALLALKTMSYEQIQQLNILTDEEHVAAVKTRTFSELDYIHSVDACLWLPLPEGHRFRLYPTDKNCDTAIVEILYGMWSGQRDFYAKTLPLAMLKAFWTLRPD